MCFSRLVVAKRIKTMKIEQLREDLIKEVLTYLDELRLPFVNKSDKVKVSVSVGVFYYSFWILCLMLP